MTRHYNARLGGFTLTELLVVVGVVIVLALLLLPSLQGSRRKGRDAVCKNLLRQIGNGLQMYVHDHDYYPPLTDRSTKSVCFERLYPYSPLNWTNSSWNCPAYVAKGGIISRDLLVEHSVGISYGYNWMGIASWPGRPEAFVENRWGLGFYPSDSQKAAAILAPSEMYAVADARCEQSGPEIAGNIRMTPWKLRYQELAPLHGKGYNILFCDGHIAFVKREDYLYPPRTAANWNCDHQSHPEAWAPRAMWSVER